MTRQNARAICSLEVRSLKKRAAQDRTPSKTPPVKKTPAQLDREIAEALAKPIRKIGIGLSAFDEDEWSWTVEQLREGQTVWGSGSDTLAGGVEYSKAEAVAKIKSELEKRGVALADAVRLPF